MTSQIIPADPGNARALTRYATEIRSLRKQVSSDIIEIGRMLVESKKLVGHGNWLEWLEREFQWTDDTALNYMRVHELAKNRNFRDLSNIPISGLFLLAAPSTPEGAKQEAISRAEAGEPIPLNTVKEIVKRANDIRDRQTEDSKKRYTNDERAKGIGLTLDHRLIWDTRGCIRAAKHHLEDAIQDLKELKPRMSEAEKYALCNAFMDVCELSYSGAAMVKPKEEKSK